MNFAAAYIEVLGLEQWQVFDCGEKGDICWAVVSIWDGAGHEQQQIVEVGPGIVRWIPLRIFRSEGPNARRGVCLWFNPAEVKEEAMLEHNRAALEASAE